MRKFPLHWVDAFTNQKLGGNPCAVILDADPLSAEEMQAVAREINLSETAFVLKSDRADSRARYFTPQGELPFAGHTCKKGIVIDFVAVHEGLKHLLRC